MNPFFPINTLQMMRGVVGLEGDPAFSSYVEALFALMWEEGQKMDDPDTIVARLDARGLDGKGFLARAQSPEVKAKLMANTAQSVERGVFGAPTFFVGGEIYFGKDKLHEVEEAIAGGFCTSEALRRLGHLRPLGAALSPAVRYIAPTCRKGSTASSSAKGEHAMASYYEAGKRLEAIRRRANSLWPGWKVVKLTGATKPIGRRRTTSRCGGNVYIEENGVESESAICRAIREAYQAGRASIASEVKSGMAHIFEGLERGDFKTQR